MQWTQRHPGRWLAPCRDLDGRRCQLIVTPIGTGRIALIVPPGAVAILEVLAAGRLRGALRDAVYALDDPAVLRGARC